MTLFASVELGSSALETSFEWGADVTVSLKQQTMTSDDALDLTVWAAGDDLRGFEEGLTADETVARWESVGGTDTRSLYRIRLTVQASSSFHYHDWTDGRAVFVAAERDSDGWTVDGYYPERSVLKQFAAGCEANDVQFELLEVSDSDRLRNTRQFGLSDVQVETMLTALDRGYYSVPRQVNLEELADPLNVSHQAVSERLRRGVGSLIRNTVATQWQDGADGDADVDAESASVVTSLEEPTLARPVGVDPKTS